VNLVAKNEQLDVVKEGATITVRNCHANVTNEHLRLEVDRWGKIEVSAEKVDKVNTTNNLSDVEYELVNVRK
jgi:replication factor A1